MSEKLLFIVRGLPGAGKSTLAEQMQGVHIEADQFWMVDGEYKFDASRLKECHDDCKKRVMDAMSEGKNVVVSNTSTTEEELLPYFTMGTALGYKVFSIIVENRHGGESIHNVPNHVIEKMRNRFSIKL